MGDRQGLVCPGRRNGNEVPPPFMLDTVSCHDHTATVTDSESSASFGSIIDDASSESSFAFSDTNGDGCQPTRERTQSPEVLDDNNIDMDFDEMLESQSECSLEDNEEIWETSSTQDLDGIDFSDATPDNEITDQVILGICFFMNFFQLFYRVSEKAILALLSFLRILFSVLGSISPPIGNLVSLLPKSLYSLKKMLREKNDGLVEYTVCPICSTLYLSEKCIIRENGHDESKLCEYV